MLLVIIITTQVLKRGHTLTYLVVCDPLGLEQQRSLTHMAVAVREETLQVTFSQVCWEQGTLL